MGIFFMDGKGAVRALAEIDELIEWSDRIQRGGLMRDDQTLVRALDISGVDYKAINAALRKERERVVAAVKEYIDTPLSSHKGDET